MQDKNKLDIKNIFVEYFLKFSIATKVLADSFDFSVEYSIKKEWNVNGESVTICLEK